MRYLLLLFVFAIASFGLWSCLCESYVLKYSFRGADVTINDKQDYNEDSTAVVETQWKQCDSLVLGDSLKVGVVLQYDYSHDVNNNTCDPEYIEFTDSVLGINVYTVYPLEGIDAGASVLEAGGWSKSDVDSLLDYINMPLYPAYGAMFLTLPNEVVDGKVQFRVVIRKARSEDVEIYSDEFLWK